MCTGGMALMGEALLNYTECSDNDVDYVLGNPTIADSPIARIAIASGLAVNGMKGTLATSQTANLPVCVDVAHFLRRDAVCMHDGPRARIVFAAKNHARFRLQGSVEPRQRVRGVSS